MGLFNLFKKKVDKQDQPLQDILKLQGPKYLRKHLTPLTSDIVDNFKIKLPGTQWIGQLISTTQNRHFQIKYYGDLMNDETIIDTDKGVQRLIAVDTDSNEEILLFDKMLHGWDGFICNTYEDQRNVFRSSTKLYKSRKNTYNFRIVLLTFYNNGTKQELLDSAASTGQVQLENGVTLDLQDAFDDAFDAIVIYAIDNNGNKFELVNEELA
ncbi:MAG: hypothetical protein Q8941_24205 [Bacteroidota bacterium]|nr:hypothetical protein [Bacteroidota bacterium]